MDEKDISDQKHVAFYAACITAWLDSALEHDKSILTLSSGGIGLLIGLITAFGLSSICAFVLCLLAMGCFLAAIACVLFIFRRNKTYLMEVINGHDTDDPKLKRTDAATAFLFWFGVLFAALLGIVSAVEAQDRRNLKMTHETEKKSVEGFARLRPQPQTEQPKPKDPEPAAPAQPAGSDSAKDK